MNIVKFRPVGKSGPIQKVRVYQSFKAMYGKDSMGRVVKRLPSVGMINKLMYSRGWVRVNG